jgi:hypothetical protein
MPGQKTRKDGAQPALFHISCYFISVVICVVCVLSGCKCVLPPGDNPIAVNKYYNLTIMRLTMISVRKIHSGFTKCVVHFFKQGLSIIDINAAVLLLLVLIA